MLKEAVHVSGETAPHHKAKLFATLGQLALYEGHCGQAIQLIKKSQSYGGDEAFWKVGFVCFWNLIFVFVLPLPWKRLKVKKKIFLRRSVFQHICLFGKS